MKEIKKVFLFIAISGYIYFKIMIFLFDRKLFSFDTATRQETFFVNIFIWIFILPIVNCIFYILEKICKNK